MIKHLNIKTKTFLLVTTVVVVPILIFTLFLCNFAFMRVKQHAYGLAEEITETYRTVIEEKFQETQTDPEVMTVIFETLNAQNINELDVLKG